MDDTGRDRHETLVRVRPKKVIVKRSIGQEKKKKKKVFPFLIELTPHESCNAN